MVSRKAHERRLEGPRASKAPTREPMPKVWVDLHRRLVDWSPCSKVLRAPEHVSKGNNGTSFHLLNRGPPMGKSKMVDDHDLPTLRLPRGAILVVKAPGLG